MDEDKSIEIHKPTNITRQQNRRGFEEPTPREDLIIPRAKLLQALSPEVIENPREFVPGDIINSLTKEKLPSEFVPIFKFTNWIRFNPRNAQASGYDPAFGPGDLIWRSDDPYDPRVVEEGNFGPEGERPLATKFLNFFSVFPGVGMPVIASFSNTSLKAGRQLLSLCQFGPADMFAMKYQLGARQEKNDKGTYYVLTIARVGKTEDNLFEECLEYWEQFQNRLKEIQVHEQQNEDPDQL